jgi:hypothetical protein
MLDQQLMSTEQRRTLCASVLGTSFSLNLTIVCNTNVWAWHQKLYHHHTIWYIQVLETPDGTQILSRHCSSNYGNVLSEIRWRIYMIDIYSHHMNSHDENSYDVNSYDIMKSYIQWCWCFLQWLESPRQTVSCHFKLIMQKWPYH